ncbi:MAG: OmpA family protein [Cyclobacteriaceae bacterium]|nr:OmpA family protein [Cyclobacteriaceae bacterium]
MHRSYLFFLALMVSLPILAQDQPHTDQSLYVVIGAFAIQRNAIEFTDNANKQNISAQYALNPKRKLFYVYAMHTENRKTAINESVRLQQISAYHDTWVYSGLLGDNPQVVRFNETERKEAIHQLTESKEETNPEEVGVEAVLAVGVQVEEKKELIQQTTSPVGTNAVVEMAGAKPFLFRITALANRDTLAGDVDIFDADVANKTRKSATYRGNDVVYVKPINKSGNMILECEVFGYRKLQLPISYETPEATDGVLIDANTIVVPFEMVRLQKGDKAIMFNVYFYKDAAIMRPESRYEVNSLLEMLTENPKYKIRIHGHTNGNSAGKIISMGDSKEFFSLTRDNKEGHGSAKKLSEERAMLIQKYLIDNGVGASRTEVKAWGGKQPIYDVDHAAAQANVRVEIEILEN